MKTNVEVEQMWIRLETYLSQDSGETLTAGLRRSVEDPLKPRTFKGQCRVSRILLLLAVLTTVSVGVFLLCSFQSI